MDTKEHDLTEQPKWVRLVSSYVEELRKDRSKQEKGGENDIL